MTPALHDLAILTNTRRPSIFELEPDPDIKNEWIPLLFADDTFGYAYHGSEPVPRDLVGTTIRATVATPPESGEPLTWKAVATEVVRRSGDDIIVRAETIPESMDVAVPLKTDEGEEAAAKS